MADEQILWAGDSYTVSVLHPDPKGQYAILRYNIKIPLKKLKGVS